MMSFIDGKSQYCETSIQFLVIFENVNMFAHAAARFAFKWKQLQAGKNESNRIPSRSNG